MRRHLPQRRGRQVVQRAVLRVLVGFPAHLARKAHLDAVRLAGMPGIVIAPDDQAALCQKLLLGCEHGVPLQPIGFCLHGYRRPARE